MSAVAIGFCRARPALVPRQPSTSRGSPRTPAALGVAASSAHRDRRISHRAALADLSGARDLDIAAGTIRPARVFSEGIFTLSDLARSGSDPRRLGLSRHDGIADRPKTARFHPAADAT